MAVTIWQSTNGDMSDAASWSLGVPASGDIGFADGKLSQRSMTSGMTFANPNNPQIVTAREFLGDVGQPGNPLIVNGAAVVQHTFRGRGAVHYGSGNITVDMVVDSLNLRDALLVAAKVGSVFVKSGRVDVDTTAQFIGTTTWLTVDGELANVVIEQSALADRVPDTIRVISGRLENKRDFENATDRLLVAGGDVLQTGLLDSTMTAYVTGGVLRYEPATDPASEAPWFLIDGGVLDIRGSRFAIPTSGVHVGRGGKVLGSTINKVGDFTTINLGEDYP